MDEEWRNIFGILMCVEVCDGAGAGICEGAPSTCSSCSSVMCCVYGDRSLMRTQQGPNTYLYLVSSIRIKVDISSE